MGWKGFDGLKGPVLSGTCFYMKREAFYGDSNIKEGNIVVMADLDEIS